MRTPVNEPSRSRTAAPATMLCGWSLSAKSLEDTKLLDNTVGQVMDAPFPVVDLNQPVDAVAKLLSKSNPAVLVRSNGSVQGIVTRSDMLNYLMAR